ncbi:MAG: hypothetical protein LBS98_01880 [Coriobacteriales bacterium]|jgi:hypothetical protein|nr:hypothetical protein [Coriobacteriales bacterium]
MTSKNNQDTIRRSAANGTLLPTPVWAVIFLVAMAYEFMGRAIGYLGVAERLSQTWHFGWVPLLTSSCSVFVVLAGFFTFRSGKNAGNPSKARTGIVLMVLGFVMIATSFMLKRVPGLLFG